MRGGENGLLPSLICAGARYRFRQFTAGTRLPGGRNLLDRVRKECSPYQRSYYLWTKLFFQEPVAQYTNTLSTSRTLADICGVEATSSVSGSVGSSHWT
ncbi:unnamed protein product [Sphagnum jensenii]|uniref:Uncharacterized protein n=1 Tax=Sphagnum jensenii TaxID=128206 RepID=A0ABP0WZ95_9BRYO